MAEVVEEEAPPAPAEEIPLEIPLPELAPQEAASEAPLPELEPEVREEPVPVLERSASLRDVPEGIWSTRKAQTAQPGQIRFAEDIVGLRGGVTARRGRQRGDDGRGRPQEQGQGWEETLPTSMTTRKRHVPFRSCVICRSKTSKRDLIRIVSTSQGAVAVDPTAKMAGRGAYVCQDGRCVQNGLDRGRVEHALRTKVKEQEWAEVASHFEGLSASC